jgi:hypothetical protein
MGSGDKSTNECAETGRQWPRERDLALGASLHLPHVDRCRRAVAHLATPAILRGEIALP